jgi:hypothetical protein
MVSILSGIWGSRFVKTWARDVPVTAHADGEILAAASRTTIRTALGEVNCPGPTLAKLPVGHVA